MGLINAQCFSERVNEIVPQDPHNHRFVCVDFIHEDR